MDNQPKEPQSNKSNLSRRQVLRLMGIGGAGAVLAACAPAATSIPQPTAANTAVAGATNIPAATAVPNTAVPAATVAATVAPTAAPAGSRGPLNITYWQDFNDEFKGVTDAFTAATGIAVNYENQNPDYDQWVQEVTTQMASGDTSVDAFFAPYSLVKRFALAGWLANINGMVADAGIPLDDYLPGTVEGFTFDGNIYALPWNADTELMAYRSAYYNDAGLAGPPQTWDELVTQSQALTIEPDRYALAVPAAPGVIFNEISKWILAAGGSVFELETPEAKQALTFYKDLWTTNKVAQPSAPQDDYGAIWVPFTENKYAAWYMWDLWTGGLAKIDTLTDLKFAWPPAGPGGVKTITNCWGYCVNAESPQLDLVAEWIGFINDIEATKIHATRGATPARVSLWSDPDIQASVPQAAFWASVSAEEMAERVVIQFQPLNADIVNTIRDNIHAYMTDQMDLDEATAATMQTIRPMLEDEGYQFMS